MEFCPNETMAKKNVEQHSSVEVSVILQMIRSSTDQPTEHPSTEGT